MTLRVATLLWGALALLAGCANLRAGSRPAITAGQVLVLEHALTVPARRWSVYLQDGQAQRFATIDTTRGYCELKVHGPKPQPQTIPAGRFQIRNAERRIDRTAARPIHVAAVGALAGIGDRHYWDYVNEWALASTRFPSIRALTCTHEQEARLGGYMSLAKIRAAIEPALRIDAGSAIGLDQ